MLIELQDLGKSFGEHEVLKHVTASVERGDRIGIIGANGTGKTTLLRVLCGESLPDAGDAAFAAGATCGYLEQTGHLDPEKDVYETMRLAFQPALDAMAELETLQKQLAADHHNTAITDKITACNAVIDAMDAYNMDTQIKKVLNGMGFPADTWKKKAGVLSGGEQTRLRLARLLLERPDILILDEPTSQLDPIAASDFLNTLRKINAELGTTILITEHRVEDIFPYADRAIVMDGGRVIANDTPRNIGKRLWEEKNDMFTAMPTPVRVFYGSGGAGECPLTVREGRNWLSDIFPNPPEITELPAQPQTEEDGEIALSLKELWFRYEKNSPDVLRGASVEVAKGSLHAIVGGNGAGKSTTLKAVCGICRPYRGKVKVLGKPVEKYKQQELFRGCLAMLPQDPKSLFVKKTVLEDLQEMTQNEQDIRETAEICQITSLLKSHPYDLSGGEQQRAALAKVLLTRPQLLLLDEPTKGIDSFFKETFASILTELKKKGITIVMVSHDVEFCARYADQVSMFFDGQVLTTDTPRRFFGANSFYTTAANRMSRHVFRNAVTAEDVVDLYKQNRETKA